MTRLQLSPFREYPHLWSLPTIKRDATLIRSPETYVDHEVVRVGFFLQLLGIQQGSNHSLCLFICLRSLHLLIVGVRSVLFCRRDTTYQSASAVNREKPRASTTVPTQTIGIPLFNIYLFQKMRLDSFKLNFSNFQQLNQYAKYNLCCVFVIVFTN